MIDLGKAKRAFAEYVKQFDVKEEKIRLKLVHTYGVMKASEYLAEHERLSPEDRDLALLIALLHDIGRFEQLRQFGTYDDRVMDHAGYGVKLLFEDGMIREFVGEGYDPVIRTAIGVHSLYQIPEGITGKELLHAQIIRDADKLDNFRVKNEDTVEAIMGAGASEEELRRDVLSEPVLKAFLHCRQIKKEERSTQMDVWVCFLAFLFDLNCPSSFLRLREQDYINRSVDRIAYQNPKTKEQMEQVRRCCLDYLERHCPTGTR